MNEHQEQHRPQAESESFTHGVFLSYSARDKAVVRELAERLPGDGVRVSLNEWEVKLRDNVFLKVEAGLQQSRVPVLCMSERNGRNNSVRLIIGNEDPVGRNETPPV